MQAAGPPRLRSTVTLARTAKLMQFTASLMLVLLAMLAFAGAGRDGRLVDGDEPISDGEIEMGERGSTHHLTAPLVAAPNQVVAVTQPSGGPAVGTLVGGSDTAGAMAPPRASEGRPAVSADGEILSVGTRVQTQYSAEYGGDGSWFAGTVLSLHDDERRATVIYDDGEEWTARLDEVYVLQGEREREEAELRVAGGAQVPPELPVAMPTGPADRNR